MPTGNIGFRLWRNEIWSVLPMNLAPLISAPLAVQIHVAAVTVALVGTAGIIVYTKGTPLHRWLGRAFVAGLTAAAVSSFWIRDLNDGDFSYIHIISVVTLIGLARGIHAARQGDIHGHRMTMILTAVGGLGVAGMFAMIAPGRLMASVFFG